METTQTASPPSFETVWAALQETDRMVKENAERHDNEIKLITSFLKLTLHWKTTIMQCWLK
jgi:hypothetical protein